MSDNLPSRPIEFEFMGDTWAYEQVEGATRVLNPEGSLETVLSGDWSADTIAQLLRYGVALRRIGKKVGRTDMAGDLRRLLAEGETP